MSLPARRITPEERAPNFYEFFKQTGRFPRLGDPISPLEYRGWLLAYVTEWHAKLPMIGNRWGYLHAIRDTGTLPAEPIPQIQFLGAPNPTVFKGLQRWIAQLETHMSAWSGLEELITWFCWGLGIGHEPSTIPMALQEEFYNKADLIFCGMLLYPYDYWGDVIADRHQGKHWNPHGFFPTPLDVCTMMVQMTMDESTLPEGLDPRLARTHDPCCGSGRMLLAASNRSLLLFGSDINPLMVKVSKINGALYAPWLTWPIPNNLDPAASTAGLHTKNALTITPPEAPAAQRDEPPVLRMVPADATPSQLTLPGWD